MFLRWAGVSVAGAALASCADATAPSPTPTATSPASSTPSASDTTRTGTTSNGGIDLGSGDIGVLNYAFALEQLEAAFYQRALQTPYNGMTSEERTILNDVRKHENIHARFFAQALGAAGIPFLSVDFSSIDFTSRSSVIQAASAFEDDGVSAYNGAGQLLTNADYLTVAGKIVSVEARHAAAFRDLLQPRTAYFAGNDTVNAQGLDVVRTPSQILGLVYPTYVKTLVDASHLPTT